MSVDDDGLLSPDLVHWISKHRADHHTWFSFAQKLNRTAQRILLAISVTQTDDTVYELLPALFFMRILSNFQGTIILCERSMVVGARLLARSCLESTFGLGAIVNDKNFENTLHASDLYSQRAKANSILNDSAQLKNLDDALQISLRDYIASLKESKEDLSPIKFEQVAHIARLGGLYIFYRQLSEDAAHPSMEALRRYVVGEEFVWGPKCRSNEISNTISVACLFLIYACAIINRAHPNNEHGGEIRAHADDYTALLAGAAAATE